MSIICVYSIVNKRNGRMYIGSTIDVEKRFNRHKKDLRAGTHHCIYLQRAWNKYGEDSFSFDILKKCGSEYEVRKVEESYLNNQYEFLYNVSKRSTGGDLISYHPDRENIVKRMTNSLKIRYSKMTPEERRKVFGHPGSSNPNYGRKHSEEAKKRISRANKGNQYAKGSKRTAEQRNKLSKIASQRVGDKNPFFGKKHSEETKKRISQANKGRLPVNSKPVSIDGVIYPSASSAAKAIGCVTATILNRIKSDKFPTYIFLDS